MRNLNDIFIIDTSEQLNSQLELAIESIIDGDSGPAYDHILTLLYDEISKMPTYNGPATSLFRFTKLPTFYNGPANEFKPVIDDIKNGAITLSNPKNYNDPMDPIFREWVKIKGKQIHDKVEKKLFKQLIIALDNLRICSLSKNEKNNPSAYLNPLMWAHYANSHKGICIQYEISGESLVPHNDDKHVLRMDNVRYRDRKAMSDFITLDNAFLAKGVCWEYEHEERLIYFSKDSIRETRGSDDYISLSGFIIKAIYLGYKISDKDKKDVINAIRGKNIDLYQIRFDVDDITRLVSDKLDI